MASKDSINIRAHTMVQLREFERIPQRKLVLHSSIPVQNLQNIASCGHT